MVSSKLHLAWLMSRYVLLTAADCSLFLDIDPGESVEQSRRFRWETSREEEKKKCISVPYSVCLWT